MQRGCNLISKLTNPQTTSLSMKPLLGMRSEGHEEIPEEAPPHALDHR
jgi:hypothetical protein